MENRDLVNPNPENAIYGQLDVYYKGHVVYIIPSMFTLNSRSSISAPVQAQRWCDKLTGRNDKKIARKQTEVQ